MGAICNGSIGIFLKGFYFPKMTNKIILIERKLVLHVRLVCGLQKKSNVYRDELFSFG